MKIIDIIRDANGNLMRSKMRTVLTIIAIFIGGFTLTVTNGIGAGVSDYIDKQLGNLGAEDVLIVQARMDDPISSGPQKFEEDQVSSSMGGGVGLAIPMLQDKDIETIKAVDGILSVEPYLGATPDFIVGPNKEKYQLNISTFIDGTNIELASGRLPYNDTDKTELVLPISFVSVLGFDSPKAAVGREVTIAITSMLGERKEVEAEVVGVQEQTLMSIGGVVVNNSLVRRLSDIQSEGRPPMMAEGYMALIARVSSDISDEDFQVIKDTLKSKDYDAQTFQDGIGSLKQVINAIIAVLNIFAVIALVAASFGIVNTLLMSVQERTKEIGLMKAMGLGGGKIFLLFSVEAILLGFWGSLFGSLAGIGAGQIANKIATDTFLKDLPGFNLTVFSPLSVAVIMLIIMGIAFIAGTLPAKRASQKDPIEALRYE